MDTIKKYGPSGEIYALPFASNLYGLWYNKELFDKFGISYPKDDMTWDDAIALGQKMTRTDGGVQYHGLGTNGGDKMVSQLSLPYIDPKTGEVLVGSADWNLAFSTFKRIFDIPGNFNAVRASLRFHNVKFQTSSTAESTFFVDNVFDY